MINGHYVLYEFTCIVHRKILNCKVIRTVKSIKYGVIVNGELSDTFEICVDILVDCQSKGRKASMER